MAKSGFKANFILSIMTLVVIYFIGEIAVRTRDALKGHNFFSNEFRDELSINKHNLIPYMIFGHKLYVKKGNEIYISSCHNELYPIKKPDNTFRIICLGGSTTINEYAYSKYKEHYPLVLQKLLSEKYPNKKIEVINLGFGAYSTAHMLILLELDVISWNPDLVIVSENHNDLTAYVYPDLTLDYSNKYGSDHYIEPTYLKNFTTLNALFRWSSFYWFLKEKWDKVFHRTEVIPTVRKSFGNEPPELSKYIFRRNLKNIYNIANAWNIKILYATQAQLDNKESTDYLPTTGRNDGEVWPLQSEFILHHNMFNKIIKEVANSTGSHFLDNSSLISNHPKYFIDDLHYTKSGVEILARNYFNFIISNNLIK